MGFGRFRLHKQEQSQQRKLRYPDMDYSAIGQLHNRQLRSMQFEENLFHMQVGILSLKKQYNLQTVPRQELPFMLHS